MERIDKIISSHFNITRSEAKSLIKNGAVILNGTVVKNAGEKADPACDKISVNGKAVEYCEFVYIMMNKPKGVISSTDGRKTNEKTVVDILPEDMKRRGVFPAGRLDKNTTGFVLLTNDGTFAHNILSPKKHIPKEYIAELDTPFDENIILQFEKGVDIGGEICLPAVLSPCENDYKKARVIIRQGRYHQIKRMFCAFGIKVVELKRISMGSLALDENLAEGDCRYLTSQEVDKIIK